MIQSVQSRYEVLLKRLELSGLRRTPQRLAVLKALASSEGHPQIEDIYLQVHKEYPMISLATIYKTISTLKEIGEVRELSLGSRGSHFDPVYGPPHPHLICTQCRRIDDIAVADLELLSNEAARTSGYQITDQQLDFYGICPDCQAKTQQNQNFNTR